MEHILRVGDSSQTSLMGFLLIVGCAVQRWPFKPTDHNLVGKKLGGSWLKLVTESPWSGVALALVGGALVGHQARAGDTLWWTQ